jgi:tRNA (guanine9-N1)-methyltransferase
VPLTARRPPRRPAPRRRRKERGAQKKAAEKAAYREKAAEKFVRVKAQLGSMTEAELAAWRAQRIERVGARREDKGARRAKLEAAMAGGQRLVLDLEFAHLMTEAQLRSLCQQLTYCYAANLRAPTAAHLVLTGAGGRMGEVLRAQIQGVDNWAVTITDRPYADHFAGRLGDLVYLTADSPHELTALDPGKAYVVGGIVDRNHHKGLCRDKAGAQGVATARLPIGEHMRLASSPVLCTNHVVEIMLQWMECGGWGEAFRRVIPTRKRKDQAGGGGGGGSGGGTPEAGAASGAAVDEEDEGGEEEEEGGAAPAEAAAGEQAVAAQTVGEGDGAV